MRNVFKSVFVDCFSMVLRETRFDGRSYAQDLDEFLRGSIFMLGGDDVYEQLNNFLCFEIHLYFMNPPISVVLSACDI